MKKIMLVLSIAFLGTTFTCSAQSYQTALGVRLGAPSGVTLQHYISSNSALEGLLGFGGHWFTLTGLYELHTPISSTPGLGWYVGFGAHIGALNGSYKHNETSYEGGSFILGVDGILGLDYTIPQAPLNLSLDWKPAINLTPFAEFLGGEFGLSVRYTFGR